jgi:hypothetical protein
MFTALSVTANAAHAWVEAPFQDGRAILGTVIAGLAPIALLLTTHTLASLVVERPEAAVAAQTAPVVVQEPVRTPARATAAAPAATEAPVQAQERPAPTEKPVPILQFSSNEERDEKIRELSTQYSQRKVGEMLGVSKTTVARALNQSPEAPATERTAEVAAA